MLDERVVGPGLAEDDLGPFRCVGPGVFGQDGGVGLRLYYKPLVLLIWLGAVVMALGGGLSLTDRRMRVGVPAKAKARPIPNAVPAE